MSTRNFDLQYIDGELQKLQSNAKPSLSVFVAGGFVMVVNGLKDGTKDIDVVVEDKHQFDSLVNVLKTTGYRILSKPSLTKIHRLLAASAVMENADGFRWDLFLKVVADKLFLSDNMKKRAKEYLKTEHLRVYNLSKEDVFLMKGLTERDRDLEDMYRTARSGLNYDVIFDECVFQSDKTDSVWESGLFEKCEELKTKYNLTVPFATNLRKIAEEKLLFRVYAREMKKGNNTVEKLVVAFAGKMTKKEVVQDLKMLAKARKLMLKGGRVSIPKR